MMSENPPRIISCTSPFCQVAAWVDRSASTYARSDARTIVALKRDPSGLNGDRSLVVPNALSNIYIVENVIFAQAIDGRVVGRLVALVCPPPIHDLKWVGAVGTSQPLLSSHTRR
jgi:hypothetical protein